ncbi:hypothetical protein TSUD_213630 [Trifolium subterraneum]|uniref:Uncharacterized protein n=1 Tax=Trifolium subterraneum TaxID=3900 RepID=A0A2Z6NZE3_TRISU|nr:hypothetical protein TSUD_213630 [Trifolium subterraneum]
MTQSVDKLKYAGVRMTYVGYLSRAPEKLGLCPCLTNLSSSHVDHYFEATEINEGRTGILSIDAKIFEYNCNCNCGCIGPIKPHFVIISRFTA